MPAVTTIDTRRHIAYIANSDEMTSTVFNLDGHSKPHNIDVASFGDDGGGIAVDELSGLAYLASDSDLVYVYRGTHRVGTITLPYQCSEDDRAVADQRRHLIYVTDRNCDAVYVIKGMHLVATVQPYTDPTYGGAIPDAVLDSSTGYLYALDPDAERVYVISNNKIIKSIPCTPGPMSIDSRRHNVFVASYHQSDDPQVTVIHGTSTTTHAIVLPSIGTSITADPHSGYAYVPTEAGHLDIVSTRRIVASIRDAAFEPHAGADPANGLVAVPAVHHLLILRGRKVVQQLPLTSSTAADYATFDPTTGKLVLTRNTLGRIDIYNSPK